MLPRIFGDGFGTGTFCAEQGTITLAANSNVNPVRMAPDPNC
jgi:hypothetical protein